MNHDHQNSNLTKGQKCEVCGMDATVSAKDKMGVTRFYCDDHAPKEEIKSKEGPHEGHEMKMGEHTGHDEGGFNKHAGHSVAAFRRKFWVSLALTVPVVFYSDLAKILGLNVPPFSGSNYIPLIFSTIVFFYGGMIFIKGAYSELKNKLPGMMTFIALAIFSAYFYSIATFFSRLRL